MAKKLMRKSGFINKIFEKMGAKSKSKMTKESKEMKDNLDNKEMATEEVVDNEEVISKAEGDASAESDKLAQQLQEQKDKYLRLFAEFENYKKRTIKEKLDLIKTASQDTLSALLPVLDDFDRAKANAEKEDSDESFSEGIQLVYNKLYTIAKNKGLVPMESTGHDFDPEFHEAFTEIPAPSEDMKGKVVDTIEKGYFLNDKIIRHAKVVVGK